MPDFYKKVFSLKPLENSCLVKGVLKICNNGDFLECSAVLTTGFTTIANYKLVACDGEKSCDFLFVSSNNLNFKIEDFNGKARYKLSSNSGNFLSYSL